MSCLENCLYFHQLASKFDDLRKSPCNDADVSFACLVGTLLHDQKPKEYFKTCSCTLFPTTQPTVGVE